MNWMMLSCKKVTELVEKKSLVGLSTKEGVRLRLHTTMCKGCAAYQKQSFQIDKLLQHHLANDSFSDLAPTENDALINRIITKLRA